MLGAVFGAQQATLLGWAAIISAIGTTIAAVIGIIRTRRKDIGDETATERDDAREDFAAVVEGMRGLIAEERVAREESDRRCSDRINDIERHHQRRQDRQDRRIKKLETEVAACAEDRQQLLEERGKQG